MSHIFIQVSPLSKILMTNIFAMMTICHYLQIEKTTMLHATPPMRMQTSGLTYNNRLGLKGHTANNNQNVSSMQKASRTEKMEHYPQTPRTQLNMAQYSSDKVRIALVHFWEFA